MSRRAWGVLIVVVLAAALALVLAPCGDESRRAGRGPDVDAPKATSDVPETPRRRGASKGDEAPRDDAPAKPDAPRKSVSIEVVVVAAADGAPVAGADVFLVEDADDKDEDVERRTRTDAAGVARFVGLPPCVATVRAWADGFVRSDFTGDRVEDGELKLVIKLDRGAPLEGVVVDARTGRPLAGATVDVVLGGSIEGIGSSSTSAPHLGRLTTGEDGRFRLRVPPDEMVTPTASARGFVPTGRTVIVHGDTSPKVELRLEAGGTLRGTVRGPNGAAVAGATVYAIPADQRELLVNPAGAVAAGGRRWTSLAATTDAAGRYELDDVARGGVYVAFAEAEGWARSAYVERVFATDAAPSADVDFAVRKPSNLVVRVLDAAGEPHTARVSIETSRDETFRHRPQETDADGATTFEAIDPGRWRVSVHSTTAPSETAWTEVADGATTECVVRMPRGASISGVVVDDLGAPVASANVNAFGTRNVVDPTAPTSFGHGETDADGKFRVEGLREEPHLMRTYAVGYAGADAGTFDAPSKDLRLVLPRTATAKLRFAAPDGARPPATYSVRAEFPTRTGPAGPEEWSGGGSEPLPFGEGRLTMNALAPGACRIRVTTAEFAPLVVLFDAKPGETIDLGVRTLDPGVAVAGRVEDASGAPVAGARVTTGGAYPGDTKSSDVRMTSSGEDGSFRLEHLTAGALDLTVASPDFVGSTTRVDAAAGGGFVVVRLSRGAALVVTVVDAAGAPVPGALVVVRAPGSTTDAAKSRADHRGVAELRVAPGKGRVSVDGRDGGADIALVEGGESAVRLVVK